MTDDDEAGSRVTFCGGSAGMSLYVRVVTYDLSIIRMKASHWSMFRVKASDWLILTSSLYPPSPFWLKADTWKLYSVNSRRSVR